MAPYLSEGFESHTARADQVNYNSPLDDAVNATSALPPANTNNMLDSAHPPTSHTDAFNTSNGTTTNGHAERASSSSSSETLPTSTPIAIVGLSCKFSGDATDASKFWDLCRTGRDSWSEMPKERFNAEAFYHPDAQRTGRFHIKGGHFIKEDVALFDAAFFNFSADVAATMDPQIRLLLESTYEAIENAGIPAESLLGSNTSVFSGTFARDWFDTTISDPEVLHSSFITGNGTAMFSNRISHFFDLQGASMTLDTGCSTSMVALHQAVSNLQLGESDISIVGSACCNLNPDMFIMMSNMSVLGGQGRCFAWDNRAEGYGRGEGVATLICKRLDDALRDGDHVHAVIRGSGLNQDGKTTSISSPSMEAQQKLIEETYRRAGLDPAHTGYVEAHMTGTRTGDPIEAEALARTFGRSRDAGDPVIVGSCKPNIGHTEPVSGLAAVVKAAWVLNEGLIPPNTNYEVTNPDIPLEEWNLQVPTALTPWPQDKPLRASINNFGYGGTNAHIILESAPAASLASDDINTALDGLPNGNNSRVFILSSKDPSGIQSSAKRLAAYIQDSISTKTCPSMADLAYTLAERRSRFPWAVAVKAQSLSELAERLDDSKLKSTRSLRTIPRIGFVFNGQGAQWHAMGRELIALYPVFEDAIHTADGILKDYGATWSLHEELHRDATCTRVHDTELSQPVTVSLQLCLVNLLKAWNISPSTVTSHSSGEIAAAYAVGVLSFQEALGVAYYRGELALKYQKIELCAGGMLAAGISAQKAEEYLTRVSGNRVVVACVNSPSSVTLSGDLDAINELASRFEENGVFARKLKVPMAYHSHHMMAMASEYTEKLQTLLADTRSWSGEVTFASPVTGGILTSPKSLGPSHWVRNLTSPVLFLQALESMVFGSMISVDTEHSSQKSASVDIILEIGAHSTLEGPIKQILKGRADLPYTSCLKRNTNAVETMQDLASDLLVRGYPVSIAAVNFRHNAHAKNKYIHDLPAYAWNHGTRFWNEPRIYRDYRSRNYPPHELLGTPASGYNRQTPTWRNFIRLADIAWLADHRLEGTVVLPGAGYISMAIEAVRLLTDPSGNSIKGYRLRDVDIVNALRIPDLSTGTETQFQLRPCSEYDLDHKGWFDFSLYSVGADNSWIQHCKGAIAAEIISSSSTSSIKSQAERPDPSSFFAASLQAKDVQPESIFDEMRKMKIYHGPDFQNLISCRTAGHKAITDFAISPAATHSEPRYTLHPTTLDSIFQAFYVCVPEEIKKNATVVPRSIRAMYVPRELKRCSGDQLRAFTKLVKKDRRGATSDAIVVDSNASEISLRVDGFHFQGMARAQSDEPSPTTTKLCAKMQWEPDVLHDVPFTYKDAWRLNLSESEIDYMKNWRRVSYYFILDAVSQLQSPAQDNWSWYHKLFFTWMQSVVEDGKTGKLASGSQLWAKASKGIKQRLIDDLNAGGAGGRLTCRVGPKLANIVRGEVTPLELMVEGNLLNQYYEESPPLKDRAYKQLRQIAELYGVKQPGSKVLEIGAGTGGATKIVLEGLGARAEDGSGTLLGHYHFTDVSSGFFEAAREKFAIWGDMMDFKKLDVERDPASQGFEAGSYDLIVASMVLHATKSLEGTMTHVRKLLKPGGKLILLENTQDRIDMHLIFGTLPGWWLSEEPERKMSPNVSALAWDKVLRATGFTGIDFEIGDCENSEFQSQSIIVSTVQSKPRYPSSISLIHTKEQQPPQIWLDHLTQMIQSETGTEPVTEQFESVEVSEDRVYILLPQMTSPFLDTMSSTAFSKIRSLLVSSAGVLWLSSSGTISSTHPLYAQIHGLLRTLNQEDSNKRCVYLDFEAEIEPWTIDKMPQIMHVLQQSFDYNVEPANIEREYAIKASMLHVPRFYQDSAQDRASSESGITPTPVMEPFWQQGRDLVWETARTGMLSDLHFTEQINLDGEVPEGMVEITASAFGLNFRDVMVALDQLDETLLGHDVAGTIARLGPGTQNSGFHVGDRVCGLAKGRIASRSRAFSTSVARIPDGMSFEEAASLPIAYGTAYICLLNIANLKEGERVLIHAATGGVGQAAMMLAQHVGAEVFVTCGTDAKRNLLMEKYNIDADHIFSSRNTSFASSVMAMSEGKGVDVVLNSLAGPMLKATWECIAQFGRFVEIGKMDLEASRRLDLTPFARSATYVGFDLLQYAEYKGEVLGNALNELVNLCREGVMKVAYPLTLYSISDMEKALRQMQGGSHIGKIVLVPGQDDKVKVMSHQLPLKLDDTQSTYMIVGGLGGIGRTTALWMIEKGAKNMLITSRKGDSGPGATKLREAAQVAGCKLEIRSCDISDEDSLVQLLHECGDSMPPVRGVVQGAMELDDTVFESMTYDQWQRATRPKVAGSINLHRHLPNLQFFVMLSSLTGVLGNVSQANYAAGNTVQDALARHRAANGLPAVSIDLGAVASVGYVAEHNETVRDRVEKNLGSNVVSLDALLRLIEAAIRDPLRTPDQSQVVTCIADYDAFTQGHLAKVDKRFWTLQLGKTGAMAAQNSTGGDDRTDEGMDKILQSLSKAEGAEAVDLVSSALTSKVAMMFNLPPAEVDTDLPLLHYGVDSLVAVELRNWLSSVVKAKLTVFEILQSKTMTEVAALIAKRKGGLIAPSA